MSRRIRAFALGFLSVVALAATACTNPTGPREYQAGDLPAVQKSCGSHSNSDTC